MAKGQKGIFISEAQYKMVSHSKAVLEKMSGTRLSWGAYLAALASGSLAPFALRGLELDCPVCGARSMLRYQASKAGPASSEPSPSASKEQHDR